MKNEVKQEFGLATVNFPKFIAIIAPELFDQRSDA